MRSELPGDDRYPFPALRGTISSFFSVSLCLCVLCAILTHIHHTHLSHPKPNRLSFFSIIGDPKAVTYISELPSAHPVPDYTKSPFKLLFFADHVVTGRHQPHLVGLDKCLAIHDESL